MAGDTLASNGSPLAERPVLGRGNSSQSRQSFFPLSDPPPGPRRGAFGANVGDAGVEGRTGLLPGTPVGDGSRAASLAARPGRRVFTCQGWCSMNDDTPLSHVPDLNNRALRCLEALGLNTVGEARRTHDRVLLRQRTLGRKTLANIRETLGPFETPRSPPQSGMATETDVLMAMARGVLLAKKLRLSDDQLIDITKRAYLMACAGSEGVA